MGILDFLTGNNAAASPWGALYQDEDAKRRAAAGDLLASMGVSPTNLPGAFGDPSKFSVADPANPPPATGFGAGASPFGFAGPGSMNGVNPNSFAAPIGPQPGPAPAPQMAAAPAAPSTDLSSVNRPAPVAPAPVVDQPAAAPARPPAAPAVAGEPAPFSLGGVGSGFGDRLMKGTRGFLGNLGNGPIGALAGGLGALVTGQNTDPSSIAAEQGSMTAQALLKKGATPAEVQAARYNPVLMKALVENYYGKDRWNVVQVGEDGDGRKTYMQQNQVDGTLRPIAGGPAASAGSDFVTGPDGKPIAIPPGANRKEFIKQVTHATADAATGKGTEAQNKAASFATRMGQAEAVLAGQQSQGLNFWEKAAGSVPVVGNYLQSPEYQKYKQASSAFITAMLRQESGAAINKSEFDRYEKELFPQPGDDPSVVAQKAQMRAAATEQMRHSAGPGFKPPSAAPAGKTSSGISWSVQ